MNNFAPWRTKAGNPEEIFGRRRQQLVLNPPRWEICADHKKLFLDGWVRVEKPTPLGGEGMEFF
jgi:hypothetical protein